MSEEQELRAWYKNHEAGARTLGADDETIAHRALAIKMARELHEAGELHCGDSIEPDYRGRDGGPRKDCPNPVMVAYQWPMVWTGSGARVEGYCEAHYNMLMDLLGIEGDNSNEEAFWFTVIGWQG